MLLLSACDFTDRPALCPYNIRLEYWYAGYPDENLLPLRVNNLQEFLYDSNGNLIRRLNLTGDSLYGYTDELKPGKYKIVAWGNWNDNDIVCNISDYEYYDKSSLIANINGKSFSANTPRLYYAEAELDVREKASMVKRIYVSHCHANLHITVAWRIPKPDLNGKLRMKMRGIPSIYGFRKGYEIDAPNEAGPHIIPFIEEKEINHETSASLNFNDEVVGEFVTYRFTNNTHQMWSLWCDDRIVVKELDLQRYFNRITDMDYNVEQEFHLLIIIEKDQIIVTEISGQDWEEGGIIG